MRFIRVQQQPRQRDYSDGGVHRMLDVVHALEVAPCKPEAVTGIKQRPLQPGPEFTEAETQQLSIIRRN